MKRTFSLVISLLIGAFAKADIQTWEPSSKGGQQHYLLSLQPVDQNNPEIQTIHVFIPKGWDQFGVTGWKHIRTLPIQASLADLRAFVADQNKSGLSEEQARELLLKSSDQTKKSKDSLSLGAISLATGPLLPVTFWFGSLFKSLSAGKVYQKAVTYTHPFSLLIISNEKRNSDGELTRLLWIDDKEFLKRTEVEVAAFGLKTASPFEARISKLRADEEAKEQARQELANEPRF